MVEILHYIMASQICRSTYIWVLLPAKLIKTTSFHNEHHSNHFQPKNFYGYKKIKFDILLQFVTMLIEILQTATFQKYLFPDNELVVLTLKFSIPDEIMTSPCTGGNNDWPQ